MSGIYELYHLIKDDLSDLRKMIEHTRKIYREACNEDYEIYYSESLEDVLAIMEEMERRFDKLREAAGIKDE